MKMAAINRLNTIQMNSKQPGRYADGGGLYLNVSKSGTKSWVFVWRGKHWQSDTNKSGRREMGLGKVGDVTLQQARQLAAEYRSLVAQEIDPQEQRKASRNVIVPKTFGEVGLEFIALKEKKWRNQKHRAQWRTTVEGYCAAIKDRPISEITQTDVLTVLNPLWTTRHETARRVLGRISNILAYSIAKGMREEPNPAEWKGRIEYLVEEVPHDAKIKKHHPALDYVDMPKFLDECSQWDAMAAKALRLLIFTATRSSETLNAQWSEFDLDKSLWLIPAGRMKLNRPHAIPLSMQALAILEELIAVRTCDYVFFGSKPNRPLSNMAMLMLLRRHKHFDVTPHGMRSTFRSWVHDCTVFDPFIAEQALAHRNPDQVEAAYLRSSAFEKRKVLMQQWSDYCCDIQKDNVVQLSG